LSIAIRGGSGKVPTPARTSVDEIVEASRAILEREGLDGLTMARVASAVGVRPPSLYKRVRDRGELVRLVANDIGDELAVTLEAAAGTGDARVDLRRIAFAFRAWALAHPNAYALLFGRPSVGARMGIEVTARSSAPLLRTAEALAGPYEALEAARTFVAWATGFVTMELADAFKLGGDVDRAFAYGVDRLSASIGPP
jgi:AcrR family transcriptional regulator